MLNFENKNVLISGGSSGIGLALAEKFVTQGANVTILSREKHKRIRAIIKLRDKRVSDQQQIKWIAADVSNFQQLEKALKNKKANFDIIINSAGETYPGKFSDLPVEIFKQLIEVNFLGTVYLTKLVLPYMLSQKSGYIVNISSIAGWVGIYGYSAYAPTKYAIRGFSKILRDELIPLGINVSIVVPPDTDTPQLAFERSMMPEITKKINQIAGEMSADKVADFIIAGMKRRKFLILPNNWIKVAILFTPLFDNFLHHYSIYLASRKKV